MNAPLRDIPVVASPDERLARLSEKLFHPMGVAGVYARTGLYEDIVERLSAFITSKREAGTEILRLPPVMSRAVLERSGYLKSFPNLLGCVCALHGTEADIKSAVGCFEAGGNWTAGLKAADLVLTPAACYPVYPLAASRGPVPEAGLRFDVLCDCFRREPSLDIDRLQSFRMREYVCIGTPEVVAAFRSRWIERARQMAAELGLDNAIEQASDPFFGRTGQMMAVSQIQNSLKFELLVPVRSVEKPTACMSFNNHKDHFGETWGLRDADGSVSHTGCVAFGMDRLTIALFATHGVEPQVWPISARKALGI